MPPANIGALMTYVNPPTSGFTYADLGCAIVQVGNSPPVGLPLTSIYDQHSRIQHFGPSASDPDLFPYAALKAFEAAEIAASRPPIFATATVNGKQHPVFYAAFPAGGAVDGQAVPLAWQSQGRQAINVNDARYLNFFINSYLATVVFTAARIGTHTLNNWVSFDNGSLRYDLYGIIDDAGIWRAGVAWDSYNGVFPTNETQYQAMLENGFALLKTLSPGLHCMINFGSLSSPYQIEVPLLYANIDGAMSEDFLPGGPSTFQRAQWNQLLWSFSWIVGQGKVIVPRQILPAPSADPGQAILRTAVVCYLLAAGATSFFTPSWTDPTLFNGSGGPAVYPISLWLPMLDALGDPNAPYAFAQTPNTPAANIAGATVFGYGVYSRSTERGTVYLNLSGAPHTVNLGSPAFDHSGNLVNSITIADMAGDYVLTSLASTLTLGLYSLLAFWIGGAASFMIAPPSTIRPVATAQPGGPVGFAVSGSPEGTTS